MLKKLVTWVRTRTVQLGVVGSAIWGAWNAWHAARHGGQPFTVDAVVPLLLAVWGLFAHTQVTPTVRPRVKVRGITMPLVRGDRRNGGEGR